VADVAGSKQLVAEVRGVLGDFAAVCGGVEPADLLASDAGRLIELSGAFDRQAAGLRALALDRVLASGVWRDEGHRSPQRYVAAKLGITVGEAHRIVATAERLREQPKTREAMRNGELSDAEADAVSQANDAEPEREAENLDAATGGSRHDGPGGEGSDGGHGSGDGPSGGTAGGPEPDPGPGNRKRESVEELRRRKERAKARADRDAREREERLHRERTASKGITGEGGWFLSAKTTKTDGHRVETALSVAMDEIKAERRKAGLEPLTYGQLLADALVRVADKSLGVMASDGSKRAAMGSVMRGMLVCDISGLRNRCLAGDEVCEIAGFGAVSLPAAEDMLGSALLAVVLKDGKDVVNVTHLGDFTDVQRDAIWARAGGICEVPGCGSTWGLEIDHDHERQHGGPSNIANGSLKCRSDHIDKTHGTNRLIGPPGRRAWLTLADLPGDRDPARDGPFPLDEIEHLLPPERPSRAGPAPPSASIRDESEPRAEPADSEPRAEAADSAQLLLV
jgi:hypothetical protein